MMHAMSMFPLLPLAKAGLTPIWHFIGEFHQPSTHLPVGLLMAAGAVEAFNIVRYRGSSKPNQTAVVCLCLGAVGSVLAAAIGWGARAGMNDSNIVQLHRWMGVSLVVFSLIAAVIAVAAWRRPGKPIVRTYQAGVLLSAALVGLVGLYGGKVSNGENHYSIAFNEMLAAYREPAPAASQPAVLQFARDIKPIFDATCVKCHGPEKQKGEYRLDTRDHAFLAGETAEEKPIVPGSADKSLLFKVILGHGDYEDKKMPPKGAPLNDAQVAMIKKWIDDGAQ